MASSSLYDEIVSAVNASARPFTSHVSSGGVRYHVLHDRQNQPVAAFSAKNLPLLQVRLMSSYSEHFLKYARCRVKGSSDCIRKTHRWKCRAEGIAVQTLHWGRNRAVKTAASMCEKGNPIIQGTSLSPCTRVLGAFWHPFRAR